MGLTSLGYVLSLGTVYTWKSTTMKQAMLIGLWLFLSAQLLNAQSTPAGTWYSEVTDQQGKVVLFSLIMGPDSTYAVDLFLDGVPDSKGKYEVEGDVLTLQEETAYGIIQCNPPLRPSTWVTIQELTALDCQAKGVYTFELDGETLVLERVREGCSGRNIPSANIKFARQ